MKKLFSRTLLALCVFSGIGLILTGYAGHLNPNTWSWLSLAGYAFPFFLLLTALCLIACTLYKKIFLPLPFLSLLLAYPAVSLYCPIHFNQTNTSETGSDSTFTILSFNTYNWVRDNKSLPKNQHPNSVIEYLHTTDADVMCLQESPLCAYINHDIDSLLRDKYPHIDTVRGKGGSHMLIISRFPIVKKQLIPYDTKRNISAAFWVNIHGREVAIVSNHLQTMGFSMEERQDFSDMAHGQMKERDEIKNTSRTIIGKILRATKTRASQADSIAHFIAAHSDKPIIVCGDFNDIPQSYTYHTIATATDDSSPLINAWSATALGPGYTYSRYAIRARIDNILCSQHFIPLCCKVDHTITTSDHFPVIATLKMQ